MSSRENGEFSSDKNMPAKARLAKVGAVSLRFAAKHGSAAAKAAGRVAKEQWENRPEAQRLRAEAAAEAEQVAKEDRFQNKRREWQEATRAVAERPLEDRVKTSFYSAYAQFREHYISGPTTAEVKAGNEHLA